MECVSQPLVPEPITHGTKGSDVVGGRVADQVLETFRSIDIVGDQIEDRVEAQAAMRLPGDRLVTIHIGWDYRDLDVPYTRRPRLSPPRVGNHFVLVECREASIASLASSSHKLL